MMGEDVDAISVVIVGETLFLGVDYGLMAGCIIGCRNW